MKAAILQPGYLPWIGFFEQIYKSDIFVLYDDVQYDKHGWRNRNRIKTANGIQWLTVPVITKGLNKPRINEVRIDNARDWGKKHLLSIKQNYQKAPYFEKYYEFIEKAYKIRWEYLLDLNMVFIGWIISRLGLERKIIKISEFPVDGDRIGRLIEICKRMDIDTFYEGAAGRNYIDADIERFQKQGITVEYQDYRHPAYKQLYGEFVPYLSTIDLLFNEGSNSLAILSGSQKKEEVNT